MRAVLLVVFAALGPSPALAETFNGGHVVIIDGDTFALGSERVRILNIDAPETRGSHCERELVAGLKAKERLAGLLRAGSVDIIRGGEDRYDAPLPACLSVVSMSGGPLSPSPGGMGRMPERPGCSLGADRNDAPIAIPASVNMGRSAPIGSRVSNMVLRPGARRAARAKKTPRQRARVRTCGRTT